MTEFADEGLDAFSSDPEILAAAAAVADENEAPNLPDPLDGPVRLPAGFRRPKMDEGGGMGWEEVTEAWVRELNGEHEERIARAKLKNDVNAFVQAVLEAGVERLGDRTPTRDDFNSMILGDRDYLLMEIARVTYGDELSYDDYPCPYCNEVFSFTLSLSEDVPLKRLDKPDDAVFDVELRGGRVASVRLPNGEVGGLVAKAETAAEANTILIANGVEEIRGPKGTERVDGDVAWARKLGVVDRQTLVTAMGERMPGPRYTGVRFKHDPGCGEEIRHEVQLAELFRGL